MNFNVEFIKNDGLSFFTLETRFSVKQQHMSLFKIFVLKKRVVKLVVLIYMGGCVGKLYLNHKLDGFY
jgi:hypothetical protein